MQKMWPHIMFLTPNHRLLCAGFSVCERVVCSGASSGAREALHVGMHVSS